MKKSIHTIRTIRTLSALLAVLSLAGCASQTADPPLQTIGKTDTSSVTTDVINTTTEESLPILTTGSDTDVTTATVDPERTSDPSATASAASESEQETPATTPAATPDTTPDTTASTPVTDPPTSSHTPAPGTLSQIPATSKEAATSAETTTTTKKATSQTPATTAETPVPTPHMHSWGSWKTTKIATCTEAGTQQRTCSGCGEIQTQTISETGHSYGAWKTGKEATCTANGTQTRTCANCGNTESKTISATGHSWGDWVVTKEPTTTAEGVETRTCSKCKHTETREIDMLPEQNATSEDCEWMAEYFLQLLNEERKNADVQTLVTDSKIRELARVRAEEITVEFSHIRPDGMPYSDVFRDFKYGIYHDMTQFGFPESYNYYSPTYCDEDIAMCGYGKSVRTKEQQVRSLLNIFKNSTAHWNSLMSADFGAAGVIIVAVENEEYPGFYEFYCEVLLSDRLY